MYNKTLGMEYKLPGEYEPVDDTFVKGKKCSYNASFGCFDIETTRLNENMSILYCWSYTDDTGTYFGRSFSEWLDLLQLIKRRCPTSNSRFVIYCHNLAYEFQYLRSIHKISEMFATDTRKPVRFLADDWIEYRCSYKLTNLSLFKFCENENVEIKKLSGYDYGKIRYIDTDMSDFEIAYSIADTISLYQSICNLMKNENDDIVTIPLTSTGYVRREAMTALRSNPNNRQRFTSESLTLDEYLLCKESTRGGNTHASWLYTGQILEDVFSYDRVSSYPHVMLVKTYPYGKPYLEKSITTDYPEGTHCILRCIFENLQLKKDIYFPYISFSKCSLYKGERRLNDNGRIITADYVVLTLTEIDLEIIKKQYTYGDMKIITQLVFKKKKLAEEYRQLIMEYFFRKSSLKESDPYLYMKSKNKLNSLFGMMLTDITRESISYTDAWIKELPDMEKQIDLYYKNRKSFLSYQHGIYVTAHARSELQKAIDLVGSDSVYVDTDSIKFIGDHHEQMKELNRTIHEENMCSDIKPMLYFNGKHFELGIWEDEGKGKPLYRQFITLGAKKYAYRYKDGAYGVTVAGLNKLTGRKYIEDHGLEEFKNETIFDPSYSGRFTSSYDDEIRFKKYYKNGHYIEETSSITLNPSSYTLNVANDYTFTYEILRKGS